MNDDIFLAILLTLKDYTNENTDKNTMMLIIEEYLDWIRYSENRYKKNYAKYATVLEGTQCYYLMGQEKDAKAYIDKYIKDLMQ